MHPLGALDEFSRLDDAKIGKPQEISVCGDERTSSMFATEGGNSCVENEVTSGSAILEYTIHVARMLSSFSEQNEGRRALECGDEAERLFHRKWRR